MLNKDEAHTLMIDLIALRKKAKETKSLIDEKKVKEQERLCFEKFEYLIIMHAHQYKAFTNYEDLYQDGSLALISAMNNYNPKKGNFFWWAHKYIGTKISRSANLHTTIRFPLKVAKKVAPHKEANLPLLIENINRPDIKYEQEQTNFIIESSMIKLTGEQKNIITLAYGLDGDKPMSINKLCKRLKITRSKCIKIVNEALHILKEDMRLK